MCTETYLVIVIYPPSLLRRKVLVALAVFVAAFNLPLTSLDPSPSGMASIDLGQFKLVLWWHGIKMLICPRRTLVCKHR
jgi:hypothetical protein